VKCLFAGFKIQIVRLRLHFHFIFYLVLILQKSIKILKVAIIPIRKLFRPAFLTTVIIVVLAIIPYAFSPRIVFYNSTAQGIFFLSLSLIFIWVINILLLYLTEKYWKGKSGLPARLLSSYLICMVLVLFIRLLLLSFPGSNDNNAINGRKLFLHTEDGIFEQTMNDKRNYYKGAVYVSIIWGFALNTFVLLILDMVMLRDRKQRMEIENAELKITNIEAINQQLKQQIKPHFLFNSLNTLKSLIKQDTEKAEDYLIKLSDFLRASLVSSTPNTVRLDEELKLCNDYLEMQKMRFGDTFRYSVNIPDNVQQHEYVPVFSLLSLLENAMKHNKFTQELPLDIKIEYKDGTIITTNNLQPKSFSGAFTGLGLENLTKRYQSLSGDEVTIHQDGESFSVCIKTLRNEDSHNRG
jgi:hypothetical protein